MSTKIALQGWNGKCNIGDDAMTLVILHKLHEKYGSLTLSVMADLNKLADYGLPLEALKINTKTDMRGMTRFPFLRSFYKRKILLPSFTDTHQELIFGGGSIFQNTKVLNTFTEILTTSRAKNPNIKPVGISISIGPFLMEADRKAAKTTLSNFTFLGLRDQSSADALQSLGLEIPHVVAPDIALLLPEVLALKLPVRQEAVLGISCRANKTDAATLQHISEVAQSFLEKHPAGKIRIFQFCSLSDDDDFAYNPTLVKNINAPKSAQIEFVPYTKNPALTYLAIAECTLMLCVRLHAAVISYAVKTPFLVYPYHAKCVDFAKTVGFEAAVVQPNDASNLLIEKALSISFEGHSAITKAAQAHFDFLK